MSTVNLSALLLRSTGRHFVSLACRQSLPEDRQQSVLLFSGFVISANDVWFYVTAGHILRDIETAMAAGSTFDRWRLSDQTAGHQFKDVPVPYQFELSAWCVIADDATGLDYAATPLDPFYRRQLEAGNVQAITREAWANPFDAFDSRVLVGIPSESVKYDQQLTVRARVFAVVLPPYSRTRPMRNVAPDVRNERGAAAHCAAV